MRLGDSNVKITAWLILDILFHVEFKAISARKPLSTPLYDIRQTKSQAQCFLTNLIALEKRTGMEANQ